MMFYGWYTKTLDEKGRISFPRSIREALGPEVVIIKKGKKIFLYPYYFKNYFKPSQYFLATFDNQGRLKLPFSLVKDWIGRWVIVKGKGEYIEIVPRTKINYSEITVKKANYLYQKGISIICDGDNRQVKI
jgi:DNA-binding transcriptional regulator/RsmH inhibitor MraZ